ncbi:hypothetical protein WMY93_016642 [Mugilogobius chulae]|uniref:Ig-like domain-containing protein n=1 Tax=Mugilogobius chulae TaxID=88201 RepID=A0AAW0NKU9_9GOBI
MSSTTLLQVVRCVPPLSPPGPLSAAALWGRLSLLCLLSAYSPQGASVSWEVDGQELADTGASQSSVEQQKSGLYSSSSVLSLGAPPRTHPGPVTAEEPVLNMEPTHNCSKSRRRVWLLLSAEIINCCIFSLSSSDGQREVTVTPTATEPRWIF